jgi:hypothetical protein
MKEDEGETPGKAKADNSTNAESRVRVAQSLSVHCNKKNEQESNRRCTTRI